MRPNAVPWSSVQTSAGHGTGSVVWRLHRPGLEQRGNAFSPAVSRVTGSEKWAVGYAFGDSIEAKLVSSK